MLLCHGKSNTFCLLFTYSFFKLYPILCAVHLYNIMSYSINRSGYWDHTISDTEWSKHVEDLDLQNIISAANANYEYKTAVNRD